MSSSLTFFAAFLAGLVSFVSPCVLPLIPGYLSFITGMSTEQLSQKDHSFWSVMWPSLLFIAGFSTLFIALGASASVIGVFLAKYREMLRIAGGILIIIFGIFMLDIIKIPSLYREARFDLSKTKRFGKAAAFILGAAFAAGWTPCVGPILASILALASSVADPWKGALLLAIYSAGLAIPFIGIALFFTQVKPIILWFMKNSQKIRFISGIFLIITGILILTNALTILAKYSSMWFPFLG